jgi:hypothetical protein
MRSVLVLGVAGAAVMAAGAAQAKTPAVEIRDAVARVTVIPEDRADVKVVFKSTNAALPLTIRQDGDKTIVDGDLKDSFRKSRIRDCRSVNGKVTVTVRDAGAFGWDAMPEVIVRAPRDADVRAGGAVFGSIGRSGALSLSNAGCGDWTVANVDRELKVNIAGSGDLRAGTTGSARINVAGSGDVALAAVNGGLDVNVAGSGDVTAGPVRGALSVSTMGSGDTEVVSVAGNVTTNLAGSGDVVVRGGRADALAVNIAGSGDVLFGGAAGAVSAKIAGSGDVRVASASGPVSKSVAGSGSVVVGPVDFED